MTITVSPPVGAVHHALDQLLASANAGSPPDRIAVHVRAGDSAPVPLFAAGDTRDALLVSVQRDGRLEATVLIQTHWTVLVHHRFRFALTPAGQLILLGRHGLRQIHFFVEDGRLHCDAGSPLLNAAQDADAMAAFDAELVSLIAEVR